MQRRDNGYIGYILAEHGAASQEENRKIAEKIYGCKGRRTRRGLRRQIKEGDLTLQPLKEQQKEELSLFLFIFPLNGQGRDL